MKEFCEQQTLSSNKLSNRKNVNTNEKILDKSPIATTAM